MSWLGEINTAFSVFKQARDYLKKIPRSYYIEAFKLLSVTGITVSVFTVFIPGYNKIMDRNTRMVAADSLLHELNRKTVTKTDLQDFYVHIDNRFNELDSAFTIQAIVTNSAIKDVRNVLVLHIEKSNISTSDKFDEIKRLYEISLELHTGKKKVNIPFDTVNFKPVIQVKPLN